MEQYTNYAKHIGADEYLLKWVATVLKNEIARETKTTEKKIENAKLERYGFRKTILRINI